MLISVKDLVAKPTRVFPYRMGVLIAGALLVAGALAVLFGHSVDAQQRQDVAPVYITTLGPPSDSGQQAIVIPDSVTVSEEDPWFGPFYTVNDPDRSVSIDIIHEYGFATVIVLPEEGSVHPCDIPAWLESSFAISYQTAATEGFYIRRCPDFSHLTSITLRVTTYPDAEVYTTHHIRIITAGEPQQRPGGGGSGGSGGSVIPSLPSMVAPTLSEGTSASRSVDENTAAGEDIGDPFEVSGTPLIFGVAGDDAASVDIVPATGQLKTKTDLDYETQASYAVTVTATNPSGASSTIAVAISVNNVDEPGTIAVSSSQLVVGTEISAVLTDPDEEITETMWLWEKSLHKIVWSAIGGADSATYTPVPEDAGHHLRVTTRYADGQGPGKVTRKPSDRAVQDPRIPTGLRAETADEPSAVVLKWTPAANAIAHWMQSTEDDGASEKWTIAQPGMAIVDHLEPGRTYRFRVLEALPPGEISTEWYELSNWVEIRLPELRQPAGLSAQPGDNVGEVVLTWTPAFYATAHWVWSIQDDGTDGKWTAGQRGKAVVGDSEPEQTYHFVVVEAVAQEDGSLAWSAPSNWADAEPPE